HSVWGGTISSALCLLRFMVSVGALRAPQTLITHGPTFGEQATFASAAFSDRRGAERLRPYSGSGRKRKLSGFFGARSGWGLDGFLRCGTFARAPRNLKFRSGAPGKRKPLCRRRRQGGGMGKCWPGWLGAAGLRSVGTGIYFRRAATASQSTTFQN